MDKFSLLCKILIFVIALMIIGNYCGSFIVYVDKSVSPIFDNLTLTLRTASLNTQLLHTACSKPINQDDALKMKLQLIANKVNLDSDADRLGHLLSLKTYCSIKQVSFQLDNIITTGGLCSEGAPAPISDQKINDILQLVKTDENKFSPSIEYFQGKNNQHYSDNGCLNQKLNGS